jgi:hypothetical protein
MFPERFLMFPEDPARTYKRNFPKVNVFNMGITRFNSTVRRLIQLKQKADGTFFEPKAEGKAKGKTAATAKAKAEAEALKVWM